MTSLTLADIVARAEEIRPTLNEDFNRVALKQVAGEPAVHN